MNRPTILYQSKEAANNDLLPMPPNSQHGNPTQGSMAASPPASDLKKIERKTVFPSELILTDPQVQKLAHEMNFNHNSHEAKDKASRVKKITVTATK